MRGLDHVLELAIFSGSLGAFFSIQSLFALILGSRNDLPGVCRTVSCTVQKESLWAILFFFFQGHCHICPSDPDFHIMLLEIWFKYMNSSVALRRPWGDKVWRFQSWGFIQGKLPWHHIPGSADVAEPSDRRLTRSFFFPPGCALSLHQASLSHSCYSSICWLICYPWMVGNSFLVFYHDLLMFRAFHLILADGFFWQFYHSPISIQHSLESEFVRWCCFTKNGWFTFDQA